MCIWISVKPKLNVHNMIDTVNYHGNLNGPLNVLVRLTLLAIIVSLPPSPQPQLPRTTTHQLSLIKTLTYRNRICRGFVCSKIKPWIPFDYLHEQRQHFSIQILIIDIRSIGNDWFDLLKTTECAQLFNNFLDKYCNGTLSPIL